MSTTLDPRKIRGAKEWFMNHLAIHRVLYKNFGRPLRMKKFETETGLKRETIRSHLEILKRGGVVDEDDGVFTGIGRKNGLLGLFGLTGHTNEKERNWALSFLANCVEWNDEEERYVAVLRKVKPFSG